MAITIRINNFQLYLALRDVESSLKNSNESFLLISESVAHLNVGAKVAFLSFTNYGTYG